MKFWQKAFFCIIIIFILGFDIMGYISSKTSYSLSKKQALEYAQIEKSEIEKSIYGSINLSLKQFYELNKENLNIIMSPYSNLYKKQGIFFQIYMNDELFYNSFPNEKHTFNFKDGYVGFNEIDNNLYSIMSSDLYDISGIKIIYIKDMNFIYLFKTQIIKNFMYISISVSFILSVIILILLIRLTKPFRKLNVAASEISKGNYNKRVEIKSSDEVGEFAKSFNIMADSIQRQIEELSEMTKNKQEFIDNLAHEIRTPVTAIVGYGELLKYANCSLEEKELAVNHIINQGKRIQNMTHKLMDLSYIKNEYIEMKPFEFKDIFPDIESVINVLANKKSIRINTFLNPLIIYGDEELIKSLIINLIDNSIKASENNSKIEIHSNNNYIEIIDFGKGIDDCEIKKIKEPFYRIDKSRNRNKSADGIGLGLALCNKICEIHNAEMIISSKKSEGTKIKILFTTLQ